IQLRRRACDLEVAQESPLQGHRRLRKIPPSRHASRGRGGCCQSFGEDRQIFWQRIEHNRRALHHLRHHLLSPIFPPGTLSPSSERRSQDLAIADEGRKGSWQSKENRRRNFGGKEKPLLSFHHQRLCRACSRAPCRWGSCGE